jgi:hypothetical protein
LPWSPGARVSGAGGELREQREPVTADEGPAPFHRTAGGEAEPRGPDGPQVEPPVGVGDDQDRDGGQGQGERRAVGGGRCQRGQRQRDADGRPDQDRADESVWGPLIASASSRWGSNAARGAGRGPGTAAPDLESAGITEVRVLSRDFRFAGTATTG